MKTPRLYTLLALLLMAGGVKLQAQIRIDKQQCFGGYDEDLVRGRGTSYCLRALPTNQAAARGWCPNIAAMFLATTMLGL